MEIINRVANSKLITFDLEEIYPQGERLILDISQWLHEGFVLREKEFRKHLETHNWEQYQGKYIALTCSSDAIIPAWAFMLVATYLQPFARKTVIGELETLETAIFSDVLSQLDEAEYADKPIIIKGCSRLPVPKNAYLLLIEKLQPVAKSLFFGEACSSVPLFKKKKPVKTKIKSE
ncbi:MAG TPA: DUF2480 family protein [Flavobacteriaceae bacterium]|nr:DUF2480 family protein [Flavobacteriaceae bacterium]